MAINVSVQYNGGLLPDIILLTQCYYHRGNRLTGPHAFGPKKIYFGHKILIKQPHDCSY